MDPSRPRPLAAPLRLPCGTQSGARDIKKRARADARGVARKALKLLAGPLLEAAPGLAPRAAPLLAAALLVGPGCGPKVAAAALKAARQLDDPLLSALQGVPLPRDDDGGADADAAPAPTSAKKGKKDDKAAAREAQRAAERKKAAADAAHNARVVASLAARAAAQPAAAAALVRLLEAAGAGEVPGAARAEPLAHMVAHAAVQQGGTGGGIVAAALLQQLQKSAATTAAVAAEPLPAECFEASGVPTGALLERFAGGQLSGASLRSATLLAALQAAPWSELAPRGHAVVREERAGAGCCALLCDAGHLTKWVGPSTAALRRTALLTRSALPPCPPDPTRRTCCRCCARCARCAGSPRWPRCWPASRASSRMPPPCCPTCLLRRQRRRRPGCSVRRRRRRRRWRSSARVRAPRRLTRVR